MVCMVRNRNGHRTQQAAWPILLLRASFVEAKRVEGPHRRQNV